METLIKPKIMFVQVCKKKLQFQAGLQKGIRWVRGLLWSRPAVTSATVFITKPSAQRGQIREQSDVLICYKVG